MTFSCIKFRRKFRIKFNLNTANDNSECKNCDNISITSIVKNKTFLVSNNETIKPFLKVNTGIAIQKEYNNNNNNNNNKEGKNSNNLIVIKDIERIDEENGPVISRNNKLECDNDKSEKTNEWTLNDSGIYDIIDAKNKFKEHLYCPLNFNAAVKNDLSNSQDSVKPNLTEKKASLSYMNVNKMTDKEYYDKNSIYCDYYVNEEYDEIDYNLSQIHKKTNDKASLDSDYSITGGYNFDTFSCTTVYNFNGSSTSF
jgi:hypothetical protein